jgi:pimeloyl-ACP methyl ester carboxylesterase
MGMWLARALVLGLLLAFPACGGSEADEPMPTGSAPASTSAETACGEKDAAVVTLATDSGSELDAALVGDGDVGVVLGHQFGSDFCSWIPFAKQLAERNMSPLAINFASMALDDDMIAGARELERRGNARIILVGASMGGTAALVAASEIDAAGVAALSAPQEFSGLDALPAVRGLGIPVLLLVGRQDERFAPDASRLFRAMRSPDKALVVTTGAEHGTDLLQDPKAERALLEFLAEQ